MAEENLELMRSVKAATERAEETAKRVQRKQKETPKETLKELKISPKGERNRW